MSKVICVAVCCTSKDACLHVLEINACCSVVSHHSRWLFGAINLFHKYLYCVIRECSVTCLGDVAALKAGLVRNLHVIQTCTAKCGVFVWTPVVAHVVTPVLHTWVLQMR